MFGELLFPVAVSLSLLFSLSRFFSLSLSPCLSLYACPGRGALRNTIFQDKPKFAIAGRRPEVESARSSGGGQGLPLSLSPSPPHSLSPSLPPSLSSLFSLLLSDAAGSCGRRRAAGAAAETRGRKAWRDPVRWIGQPSIRGCACRGDPPARFDFSHAAFPGWPTRSSAANEDGGGRARLAQTAARPVAECWPRHLRCHARARTRAHARRAPLYDEHGARE